MDSHDFAIYYVSIAISIMVLMPLLHIKFFINKSYHIDNNDVGNITTFWVYIGIIWPISIPLAIAGMIIGSIVFIIKELISFILKIK